MLGQHGGGIESAAKCAEPDYKEMAASLKTQMEIKQRGLDAIRELIDIGYHHSLDRESTVLLSAIVGDLLISIDQTEQRYLETKQKAKEQKK